MPRYSKAEAITIIQGRRAQIRSVLEEGVPARELGRKLTTELERTLLYAFLSDVELGLLSAEYLNDIVQYGWWSEVGRLHLKKALGARSPAALPAK